LTKYNTQKFSFITAVG